MKLIYDDNCIAVCVKPPRVLSTDEPGGMPSLVREALGNPDADIRTVHRLDRVVGGLMVLARGKQNASRLSESIREDRFEKKYLAVVHGSTPDSGTLRNLLLRDRTERKTYVVEEPGKDVQEAILNFRTLGRAADGKTENGADDMSLVEIELVTGRTHQIRCQFAAAGYPLYGDRKYGIGDTSAEIGLWSYELRFPHPETENELEFSELPPCIYPWDSFEIDELIKSRREQ